MKKGTTYQSDTFFEQIKDSKKVNYRKSEAVKLLEALADEAARKRYPNTPQHYLAPRKFRDDTANALTQCIIQFIRLKGGQSEIINSTGRRIDTQITFCDVIGCQRTICGTHWINNSGTNGTSDVSATIAGRSVKVEVKIGADRQSEAQKQYQQSIEQAGGIYIVASSFEKFLTWYNLTFKP
ncbi:MAG TPA: hypothetical protein DCR40_00880 [Prolixibacteraceae bacterium]|nr:hypothetical protein [Prolixibacteraceae bacterium]